MSRELPRSVERLLRSRLRKAEDLLPFARAVVLHLYRASATNATAEDVAESVLAALDSAIEPAPSTTYDPGDDLSVLSSFFQNADLLDPASPRTRTIARGVMSAVERIGAHP